MGRLLYDIQTALVYLFPLVWIVTVVVIIRTKRRVMPASVIVPESAKRPPRILYIVPAYIILSIATFFIRQRLTIQHFDHALNPNITVLTFTGRGQTFVLRNKQEIARVIELIKNAPAVSAHHSHPTDAIVFSIDASAESYSLGVDSTNSDEYWLEAQPPPDSPELGGKIKQLHSPELTAWLEEHGLRAKK